MTKWKKWLCTGAIWAMFIAQGMYVGWREAHSTRRLTELGWVEQQIATHEILFALGSFIGAVGLVILSLLLKRRSRKVRYDILTHCMAFAHAVLAASYAVGIQLDAQQLIMSLRFAEGVTFGLIYAGIMDVFQKATEHYGRRKRQRMLAVRAGVMVMIVFITNRIGYAASISVHAWMWMATVPFIIIAIAAAIVVVHSNSLSKSTNKRDTTATAEPTREMTKRTAALVVGILLGANLAVAVFTEVVPDFLPLAAGESASVVATYSPLAFGLASMVGGWLVGWIPPRRYASVITGSLLLMTLAPFAIWGSAPLVGIVVAFLFGGLARGLIDTIMKDQLRTRYQEWYPPLAQLSFASSMVIMTMGSGMLFASVGVEKMWLVVGSTLLIIPVLLNVKVNVSFSPLRFSWWGTSLMGKNFPKEGEAALQWREIYWLSFYVSQELLLILRRKLVQVLVKAIKIAVRWLGVCVIAPVSLILMLRLTMLPSRR